MEKILNKRISSVLAITLAFLSGCTKKYTDDDVKKFIRDDLQISSFEILSGPEEVQGDDGYTDRRWTVSTGVYGLEEDLVFHVYDDRYYGMEWTENCLRADLSVQKQSVVLDTFPLPDGILIIEDKDESGRTDGLILQCMINGRQDFERGRECIRSVQEHMRLYPSLKDTRMNLRFRVAETEEISDRTIAGREHTAVFTGESTQEEIRSVLQKASDHYLRDCIENGLLSRMDEYTVDERAAVIAEDEFNAEIFRIGETVSDWPGYGYHYRTEIPYGTLYRILQAEGYAVTGDWQSFSFTGDDGETYVCDYENGTAVSVDDLNACTHLHLDDAAPLQEICIDEKLLHMLEMTPETFVSAAEAMDDVYRSIETDGNTVHMTGKGRQFSRIIRQNEKRLNELQDVFRSYGAGYAFVYENLNHVYQGIGFRMGTNIPQDTAEDVIREAAALAALNQVLNEGKIYDWHLDVSFSRIKDGEIEKVLDMVMPQDSLDMQKIYNALNE